MKKNSNWEYFFSKSLNMKFAVNKETGEIMTEDKILYTKEELKILEGGKITLGLHLLKSIFDGIITSEENEKYHNINIEQIQQTINF